jgi:hypothetical protein
MAYLPQKNIVIEDNSGEEILIDSELQVWTDVNTLTNFTFADIGDDAVLERDDTLVYDADLDYSAKITTDSDGTSPAYIYQSATGLTPGDYLYAEVAGYADSNSEVTMVMLNGTSLGTSTQYFDKVTNDWATITVGPEDYTVADTAAWNSNYFKIKVPASGIITVAALVKPMGGLQGVGHIGRVSLDGPVSLETNDYKQQQVAYVIERKDIDLTVPQDPIKIWTIPAGYKAIVVGFYIENDGDLNVNTAGAYSIGTNSPTYDNLVNSDTQYPTVKGEYLETVGVEQRPILKGGDEIYFNLETVWDADKAKAKIYALILLMRKDYNDFIGDFGEGGFGSMVQM